MLLAVTVLLAVLLVGESSRAMLASASGIVFYWRTLYSLSKIMIKIYTTVNSISTKVVRQKMPVSLSQKI